MDQFYLYNKTLYRKLVDEFDPTAPVAHFSRHTAAPSEDDLKSAELEQENPNMIVCARIRPMLDEDVSAGFPRAAYSRETSSGNDKIVDLHDLYHHPIKQPELRV